MDAEWIRDRLFNAFDHMEVNATWAVAQEAQRQRAVHLHGEEDVRTMLMHGAEALRSLGEEIAKIETHDVLREGFRSICKYLEVNVWDLAPLAVAYDLLAFQQSSSAPLPQPQARRLQNRLADATVWRAQLAAPLDDRSLFEEVLRTAFSVCSFYREEAKYSRFFQAHRKCVAEIYPSRCFISNAKEAAAKELKCYILGGSFLGYFKHEKLAQWAAEARKAQGLTAVWVYEGESPNKVRSWRGRVLYEVRRGDMVTGKILPHRRSHLPGYIHHVPSKGIAEVGYSCLKGYRFWRTCGERWVFHPPHDWSPRQSAAVLPSLGLRMGMHRGGEGVLRWRSTAAGAVRGGPSVHSG